MPGSLLRVVIILRSQRRHRLNIFSVLQLESFRSRILIQTTNYKADFLLGNKFLFEDIFLI